LWPRYEPLAAATVGAVTASSVGTLVTPSGSSNTKGSWAELSAATGQDADGFMLFIHPGDVGIADFLVDIGIGAAASEVVILPDFLFTSGGADSGAARVFIPIPIPAGSRVAARCQSTDTAAASVRVGVALINGGLAKTLRRSVATTYGADTSDSGGTAVDPGASTNTKGSWAQLAAALTFGFDQCVVCFGQRNNAANASQNQLFDLGLGAAASEVVLIGDLYYRVQASEDINPKATWLPVGAKAGQRLSARAQSSSNDATDRVVDVVVIGFS
jgi:hypothetical protein